MANRRIFNKWPELFFGKPLDNIDIRYIMKVKLSIFDNRTEMKTWQERNFRH